VALVAEFTEPLNSMVRPDQREYVDKRAEKPGVSRGSLVRDALDLLMTAQPLDSEPDVRETVSPSQ
jgi:hypothetical protein